MTRIPTYACVVTAGLLCHCCQSYSVCAVDAAIIMLLLLLLLCHYLMLCHLTSSLAYICIVIRILALKRPARRKACITVQWLAGLGR